MRKSQFSIMGPPTPWNRFQLIISLMMVGAVSARLLLPLQVRSSHLESYHNEIWSLACTVCGALIGATIAGVLIKYVVRNGDNGV